MSFRKEKKYRISYNEKNILKDKLIQRGMTSIFPRRQINSCYFDSNNFKAFFDSEEGVLPRKKIRIRWYNSSIDFTKEIKISSLEGRFKYSNKLNLNSLKDVIKHQIFDYDYGILSSKVIVSYVREYYNLENLRITFDYDIIYKYSNNSSLFSQVDLECVMEVKAPIECSDDYIGNFLHIPSSRFSKYSRGVLFFQSLI